MASEVDIRLNMTADTAGAEAAGKALDAVGTAADGADAGSKELFQAIAALMKQLNGMNGKAVKAVRKDLEDLIAVSKKLDATNVQKFDTAVKKVSRKVGKLGGGGADGARVAAEDVGKAAAGVRAGIGTAAGKDGATILSKEQQAAQFQSQVMLEKLGKLQKGLGDKSSQTAQALKGTIAGIQELSRSGEMNASVIAKMTAMYEDFIRNSVELPPDELVALSKEINASKVALEKTLKTMAAAVPEVKIEVSPAGLKNVEALQHKLEVIGAAKNLDAGLLALEVAAQKTSKTIHDQLVREIQNVRELMTKPLDAGVDKQLRERAKKIADIMAKAGGKDTKAAGGAASQVIGAAGALGGTLNNSERIKEVWGEIARRVGGSGQINEGLARMLGQSRMLGSVAGKLMGFMKGIGGLIAGAAAAAYAMLKKVHDYKLEVVQKEQQNKLDTFRMQLDLIERQYSRSIEMSERRARAIRNEISAQSEMAAAINQVSEAMEAYDRNRTTRASMTGEQRFQNEQMFAEWERQRSMRTARTQFANDKRTADTNLTQEKETLGAMRKRRDSLGKLRGSLNVAFAKIRDHAPNEEMSGVFDFGALMNKYGRQIKSAFRTTFGTEFNENDFAEALKDFKGSFKDLLDTVAQKMVQAQDEIARQEDVVKKAGKTASLFKKGGLREQELDIKGKADAEAKRKAEEDRQYEREIEATRRRNELQDREERRFEEAEDHQNYMTGKGRSYQEEMNLAEDKLARYQKRWKDEEAKYENEKTKSGVALKDAAEGDMTEDEKIRRQRYESRIEQFRTEAMGQGRRVEELRRQGGDVDEYDWTTREEKRQERIDEEDRQRNRRRIERVGGPMAGLAMAGQEVDHWKKMEEDARKEFEAVKKKYTGEDGQVDFRALKANALDYKKYMDNQQWMTEYASSRKNAEAELQNQQDDREARRIEFMTDANRQGNRLTRMGLGGDVSADFNKATAGNTKELVSLTKEMLKTFRGGMKGKRLEDNVNRWSM